MNHENSAEVENTLHQVTRKTNAQSCKEYREKKKKKLVEDTGQIARKKPKTSTERSKEHRERKKKKIMEDTGRVYYIAKKKPKTSTERSKEHRERKKKKIMEGTGQIARKKPKTSTERSKERRERQKQLALQQENTGQVLRKSQAEYMREYRRKKKLENESRVLKTSIEKDHSIAATNVGVLFPERRKLNRDKCCVEGCNSRADRDLSIRFHRLPKPNASFIYKRNMFGKLEKTDLQKMWLKAIKIKTVNWSTKVCSLHFKKEDYILPDVHAQKRYLKKQAFPSLYLPTTSANVEKTIKIEKCEMESNTVNSEETIAKVNKEKELKEERETITKEAASTAPLFATKERLTVDDFLINLLHPVTTSSFKDSAVQVTSGDLTINFLDFIKTDSDLRTATGLESFKILDTITEIVKATSENKFEKNIVKMNTRTRVVMTYMKLKQNLSYNFLCVIFSCYSPIHCTRVFEETIKILSDCLRVAISWPLKEEISKNFPQSLQGFENVRIILDCTEIFITNYTACKGFQTAKIMTGVSTSGNIAYVSKVYGRKVSDTAIFEQSDLLQLLQPGDAIVVDERFLIDALCEQNQWKCIRPPVLKERKQFTDEESTFTAKIAAAKMLSKQAIQRIKNFKVFETKMPSTLVPLLEDIFTVICATINMNFSINNDENS